MRNFCYLCSFLIVLLVGNLALANNAGISYQGRIFKPDGSPLEGSNVQFRIQVRSPGGENCLLFEEIQNLNMLGTSGIFSLTLNDGTGTRIDTATYQLDRIFANRETMTLDASRCVVGTSYAPNVVDGRKLIVYFKDETMSAYEPLPIMNLNYVPQSMYALEAQKVGPFAVSQLLRTVDGSGNPVSAPALDPTQLTNLNNLIAGTSAQYATTTAFNTVQNFAKVVLPTCNAGEVLKSNGTTFSCVTDTSGGSPSYSTLTAASAVNTLDNLNFAQTWNWSTATTQNPMSIAANALTTGSVVNISTSSGTLNSTNGLLNIANTGASTTGILARFQSNSTAGSGLTVLSNGNVGIGKSSPSYNLDVGPAGAVVGINVGDGGIVNPLKFYSPNGISTNFITSAGSGAIYTDLTMNGSGSGWQQNASYPEWTSRINILSDEYSIIRGPAGAGPITYSSLFTVKGSGNVGIGTTTPTARLHIIGADSSTASAPEAMTVVGGTSTFGGGEGGAISLTAGNSAGGADGGDVTLRSGNTSNNVDVTRGSYLKLDGSLWSGDAGNATLAGGKGYNGRGGGWAKLSGGIEYSGSAGAPAQVVTNGGNYSTGDGGSVYIDGGAKVGGGVNGNIILGSSVGYVGIGIANPTRLLHVNGPMRLTASVLPASPSTGDIAIDSGDANKLKYYDGSTWQTGSGGGSSLTGVTSVANSGGNITLSPVTTTGAVLVDSGTPATGVSNGALVVTGGVGVSGSVYSGGSINAGSILSAVTSIFGPQVYGSSAASGNIKIDGTSDATKGNVLLSSAGGSVGVGTLTPAAKMDVAGEVKVGTTGLACSTTTKGSIRYNDTTSVLEFCNGTAWNLIQAAACSDATPSVFSFNNEANSTLSTLYTSNIVQLTGINCSVPVTISGTGSPQFQICSDAACSTVVQGWTNSPSSITTGQYIQTRLTTDNVGGSMFQATIIVGSGASVWSVTNSGGDCTASPTVGTVCADGTIYAGLSPDGNVKMYTTRCDVGQTWDGVNCTGSPSGLSWNNGTGNWVATGYTGNTTGKSNSAGVAASVNAASPHVAPQNCETLNQNGLSDWYLPARSELNVLYSNNTVIKNFNTAGNWYWSSTESNSFNAFVQRFSDGYQSDGTKSVGYYVRCVRR